MCYTSILSLIGHQSTYSDIGTNTADALSVHNDSNNFLLSAWQMIVVLMLLVWGALFVVGRRSNASDKKPRRVPDERPDEGGVGGLN